MKKTPRTTLQAKITRLEAKLEEVREMRQRFEIRAWIHEAALNRRLPNLNRAEQKAHSTAGTPEYRKTIDRYNRLGTNYNKEKAARDKATAR